MTKANTSVSRKNKQGVTLLGVKRRNLARRYLIGIEIHNQKHNNHAKHSFEKMTEN